ncbi:hypothetical protein FLK61_36365 [Paenalkalicoccus suaedae]|uniref:Uncharacterized protein n=1 Tax=Paenalkalicoccus suaedae TaxID=2592382 RepID=A0A859FIN8_9BACI|nr:hypothetical protein [Paenalkalicoccus suaedae]QKS72136.1 hypothetical protein FLK61_36365 [Paenalkalicoccus suaedae]
MARNKIFILAGGLVILIALSALLILSDQTGEFQVAEDDLNTVQLEDESSEQTPSSGGDSVPLQEDIAISEGETLDPDIQEDLIEQAQDALEAYRPDPNLEPFSSEALYEHALLYNAYQIQDDENVLEEDLIQEDAEWIALELRAWFEYAEDEVGYSYDEEDLLRYVENEEALSDSNASLTVLLDELEADDESLYLRQLEYQFAKSFLWGQISEGSLSDEEEIQAYYATESEILERLSEQNPGLFNSDL